MTARFFLESTKSARSQTAPTRDWLLLRQAKFNKELEIHVWWAFATMRMVVCVVQPHFPP
jgi:hypothetical protein